MTPLASTIVYLPCPGVAHCNRSLLVMRRNSPGSFSEVCPAHDMITVEHAPGRMAGDSHGRTDRHPSPHHIPHRGPAQVMERFAGYSCFVQRSRPESACYWLSALQEPHLLKGLSSFMTPEAL
jgi:hypothetical protein